MIRIELVNADIYIDQRRFDVAYAELSVFRQTKCSAYRFLSDQRLSLAAGVALDRALRSIGSREKDAVYAEGSYGRPMLKNLPGYHFNLSHSGRFAVCVLSDREVGIDLQKNHHAKASLIRYVCTEKEQRFMASMASEEADVYFTRLWTMKESYVKMLGIGLSLSLKQLEVDLEPVCRISHQGMLQKAVFYEWQLEDHQMALCLSEGCDSQCLEIYDDGRLMTMITGGETRSKKTGKE